MGVAQLGSLLRVQKAAIKMLTRLHLEARVGENLLPNSFRLLADF